MSIGVGEVTRYSCLSLARGVDVTQIKDGDPVYLVTEGWQGDGFITNEETPQSHRLGKWVFCVDNDFPIRKSRIFFRRSTAWIRRSTTYTTPAPAAHL